MNIANDRQGDTNGSGRYEIRVSRPERKRPEELCRRVLVISSVPHFLGRPVTFSILQMVNEVIPVV